MVWRPGGETAHASVELWDDGAVSLTIEPAAGALGAYVTGLDLTAPIEPETVAELRRAVVDHLVVFLPDQPMDLDQLEHLTELLGGRDVTPFVTPVEGRPYVIRVIKEPDDQVNFGNAWHTDLSYLPEPPSFTLLHSRDVPSHGGDTVWANQYLAYSTLSDGLCRTLDGLRAVHSAGMAYGTSGYQASVLDKTSMAIAPSEEAYRNQVHPVVVRHPESGRPTLYVNPVYTTRFEGWSATESHGLLAHLFHHSVHDNFTCRLRWQPHMLAIWDNRCTQHLAINDYRGQRREMFRTSVKGSAPQAHAGARVSP
jgi:taurine dioxygenase